MVPFKRVALDYVSNQPTQPLLLFKVGNLICQKNSNHALIYLVSRIQMIENMPYYHLKGSDGSYRIVPHTLIALWRQTTEKERQEIFSAGFSYLFLH